MVDLLPPSAAETAHISAAVNVFRIAARSLLLPRDVSDAKNAGKQKELEVETVILRTCTKLKTIGMAEAARSDCLLLEHVLDASASPSATGLPSGCPLSSTLAI